MQTSVKNILVAFIVAASMIFTGMAEASEDVTMHKSEGCMCCDKWAEHLHAYGFKVTTIAEEDLFAFKQKMKVPYELGSCHTAIVGGYVIEGHVPASEIQKLLAEQPDAIGLSVPRMPAGSPGMDMGSRYDPYDVILFKADGSVEVYASYK